MPPSSEQQKNSSHGVWQRNMVCTQSAVISPLKSGTMAWQAWTKLHAWMIPSFYECSLYMALAWTKLNLYASFLVSMRIIHESSLASFLSHGNENQSKQQEAGWGLGTRPSCLCSGSLSHQHCSLEVTLHCLSWLMTSALECLIYMWMSTSKQTCTHMSAIQSCLCGARSGSSQSSTSSYLLQK